MAKLKAKSAAHKAVPKPEKAAALKPRRAAGKKPDAPGAASTAHGQTSVPGSNGHPAAAGAVSNEVQLAQAQQAIGTIKSASGVELTEKVKELLRLAQEQGYLTYNDINDALPDSVVSADELDEIYSKLRNLD